MGEVPTCFTSVPLTVFWGDQEEKLRLVGGLLGVSQHDDQAVSPEPGWVIVHEEPVDPLTDKEQWMEEMIKAQASN